MPNRNLFWILGILGVVLVALPLAGAIGMMAKGTNCCTMTGNMILGLSVIGVIWTVAAAGAILALIVLLVRHETRT